MPERPAPPASIESDPQDPHRLHDLGAESETARAVQKILPWVISVAVHLAVIVLGFLVTWTVVMIQRDQEPALIVADFDALVYEPLARLRTEEPAETERLVQDRLPTEQLEDQLDLIELTPEPLSLAGPTPTPPDLARFSNETQQARATFVGLSSTNARRIVYVIDASGSMIRSLPIVLDELARSMDALSRQQEFGVIFFQQNRAVVVPPAGRLSPADEREKARVLRWIDEQVIPAGRSNPLAALEAALALDPDVIFLLSENITGSGEFEINQTDLLQLLDTLNPRDPRHGRRPTQINCVQFLDPDPLGTLERIAELHGGPRAYKFLDRRELNLRER